MIKKCDKIVFCKIELKKTREEHKNIMAKKIEGKFKYLVDYMNNNGISISDAARVVNRDYTTVRNWINGVHLSNVCTVVNETKRQEDRNVAVLISTITGDPKEKVVDEIRKYLISTGKLRLSSNSVMSVFYQLKKDIENGKIISIDGYNSATEKQLIQVVTVLENDMKLFGKL